MHPTWKTPAKAQALCGAAAMLLAGIVNVKMLAELLDIGVIIGYGTLEVRFRASLSHVLN